MLTKQMNKSEPMQTSIVELADAHCHLDLMNSDEIREAVQYGVRTIITNGVDTKSNMAAANLHDGKNIFAMLGVDPEHGILMPDAELEFNIKTIRSARNLAGIGEIGLDKNGKVGNYERQKLIFERFVDLAIEMQLPMSIHSRNAVDEVLSILETKGAKKAHIHFFDGGVEQAKRMERMGYMLSIPPLESSRRRKIIKEVSIDNIMVESDSPVATKSPKEVRKAIEMVAEEKRISFERAAEATVANTKRFFTTGNRGNSKFMRY